MRKLSIAAAAFVATLALTLHVPQAKATSYLGSTLFSFTFDTLDGASTDIHVTGTITLGNTYVDPIFGTVGITGIGGTVLSNTLLLNKDPISGPYAGDPNANNLFYPANVSLGIDPYDQQGFSFRTGTGGTGYGFRIFEFGNDPIAFYPIFDDHLGDPTILLGISTFQDASSQTPLPAALPLFATGLGVLGFGAYRRKRKQVTA